MGKFLKFERMITPLIIQLIFWIGFLGSILGGISLIGFGFIAQSGDWMQIVGGVLSILIGPIIIRVYCEILIVVFKMQGALIDIRDLMKNQQQVTNEEVIDFE